MLNKVNIAQIVRQITPNTSFWTLTKHCPGIKETSIASEVKHNDKESKESQLNNHVVVGTR